MESNQVLGSVKSNFYCVHSIICLFCRIVPLYVMHHFHYASLCELAHVVLTGSIQDWVCETHGGMGEMKDAYTILGTKAEGKRSLGGLLPRWEDKSEVDRIQCQAVVDRVINIWIL